MWYNIFNLAKINKAQNKKEGNIMIATIVCVVLLVYLALSAARRCYKKHWGWTLVYLALYCVIFVFFRNDTLTSLINNRASYVFETITDGYNSVVVLLVVLYAIITLLTFPFAKRGRHQSMFLCMYLLYSIVKLSFIYTMMLLFYFLES